MKCSLCKNETDDLYQIAEQAVLDMIKKDNPEWIERDGTCEKCIEYYKSLDDAIELIE